MNTSFTKIDAKIDYEAYTRFWYAIGRDFIPPLENLSEFIGRQIMIFYSVYRGDDEYEFSIDNVPCACINLDEHYLKLPASYFDPYLYESIAESFTGKKDYRFMAVANCNGSLVHEALHATYTKPASYIKRLMSELFPEDKKLYPLILEASKMTEDLFIENAYHVTYGPYKTFLDAKNTFFFSEKTIQKMSEAYENDPTIENAIYLLAGYKNRFKRDSEYFNPIKEAITKSGIDALVSSSLKPLENGQEDRLWIAYRFIKYLLKNSESESDEDESGEDESGETESGEDESDEDESGEDESGETEISETKKVKEALTELYNLSWEETERIKEDFEIGKKQALLNKNDTRRIPKIKIMDVLDKKFPITTRRISINNTKKDFKFLSNLLKAQAFKTMSGQPEIRGYKICNNRIYRIATDSKIFHVPENVKINPLEIIILVDSSGSMSYMYGCNMSLFDAVYPVAVNIYNVLSEARIKTSLYLHTSIFDNAPSESPFLVKVISTDNESFKSRRIEIGQKIEMQNNYDGIALEALRKLHPSSIHNKQLWIVLSDGNPAGDYDYTSYGEDHTKKAVKSITRDGNVKIISVSLVESVVNNNNRIYGEENNIDASDISTLKTRMTEVIEKSVFKK